MYNQKGVSVIIPVKNEAKTIADILEVLLAWSFPREIIVVNDASVDETAEVLAVFKDQIKVISLEKSKGKGRAMVAGVAESSFESILFLDGDLIGLTESHIDRLIQPVVSEECRMCVGVRNRYGGLPLKFIKLNSLLAIGGERCLKRDIFESVPNIGLKGFSVETSLNYYCKLNRIPICYAHLDNLDILTKEEKRGWLKGGLHRLKMCFQMMKIWLIILFKGKDIFKK